LLKDKINYKAKRINPLLHLRPVNGTRFMKIDELRRKSKEEIQKVLRDDREKLRQLKFDLVTGKVKNVREIRKVKKEIAQILTLLTELRGSGAKVKKRTKSSSPQE